MALPFLYSEKSENTSRDFTIVWLNSNLVPFFAIIIMILRVHLNQLKFCPPKSGFRQIVENSMETIKQILINHRVTVTKKNAILARINLSNIKSV